MPSKVPIFGFSIGPHNDNGSMPGTQSSFLTTTRNNGEEKARDKKESPDYMSIMAAFGMTKPKSGKTV